MIVTRLLTRTVPDPDWQKNLVSAIFCKLSISSVQIGNYSLPNVDESIPVASAALSPTMLATEMHINFCYLLSLYASHYLTRDEMKMPGFTVIRNGSEDGPSEKTAGEWYLASTQIWSSAQYLTTGDLFAAFPFSYVTGYISSRCTLYRRIGLQYFPECLLLLCTQKSKPVLVHTICS